MTTIKKKKRKPEFSLVSPQAMGGIHGGDGYTYQDRYIVCNIPKWISDPTFVRLMPEGTGDVDVVFLHNRKHFYDHIQVKNHLVTNSEFGNIIKTFSEIHSGTKKVYRTFYLACPQVGTDVNVFCNKLSRYKDAQKLYAGSDRKALKSTEVVLKNSIKKLKLQKYYSFIVNHFALEIGKYDFGDTTICKRQFVSYLNEHPKYKEKVFDLLSPAYPHLIEQIVSNKGKVFTGQLLYKLIDEAIAGKKAGFKTNVIHIHNWEKGIFEPKANITIDWTKYFDRSIKKVPDSQLWNDSLIPELVTLKNKLTAKTSIRHITLRGKCALSTGISLGMIFPEIGNWTFELLQPPQTESWRSDAERKLKYKPIYSEINPSTLGIKSKGDELAVVFNITGKALFDVADYFKSTATPLKKIISLQPEITPGTLSIRNGSEAVALASASKDIIKNMITKYNSKKIHLFYFGPFGLAVFLGQKLTSVGSIQLYEFQDPGYKPSCLLKS